MSKVTEAQVGDFLGIMRTNDASVDVKVSCLNDLRASIRHYHLPDSNVAPIFDIVRAAMTSQHTAIQSAGFSTLQHLLKRLALQEPKHLVVHGPRVLPLLADRLGDQKDRPRGQASQCLSDLWKVCPQEVERLIRDSAMVSRNPRTKEQSLRWIAKMSKEHHLQFRSFVSRMVDALEDADGMVRDTAKATVVELFQHAPMHARADLKRQLQQHNVRRSIVNDVLSQLPVPSSSDAPPQPSAQANHPVDAPSKVAFLNEVANGEPHPPSVPSTHSDHDYDQIEPTMVTTQRELDETFRDMHGYFEGRENEGNWMQREKSILRLRKLTKGNVLRDYPTVFLAGIKSALDGILKCVNSLRTTLSTHSCSFVQELARAAGPGLDPMVELLLQNLIRLCAGTKKISSQMGNTTVDIIFANVSYSVRILQHVWGACQDKNVQPRLYAAGWLETIITKQAHHRHQLEHTGGLDYIEKCIRKGLSDPNPGVREAMRKTFWVYSGSFSDKADLIMSSLDPNSKRSLEKHPANPNSENVSSHSTETSTSSKPMFARSTAAAPVSRTTLKETIAARKREAAASRHLPSRPESAQSAFSPSLKHVKSSSNMSSSLASAPMRPMRAARRPEIHRPATAEPFASRRLAKAGSPGATNAAAPLVKSKSKQESPTIKSIRNRPTRADSSPAQSDSMSSDAGGSSNSRRDEELTMVIPRVNMDRVYLPVLPETETVPKDQSRSPTKEIPFHPATPHTIRRVQPVVEEEEIPLPSVNGVPKDIKEEPMIDGNGSVEPAVVPASPGLRVYEDPSEASERQTSPARPTRPTVLEERTVNEPLRNGTSPISSRSSQAGLKTPQTSPRKKIVQERASNTPQGRRLLNSTIAQVQAGQTDLPRLRRIQSGLEGSTDLWPDASGFGQLLCALLDIVAINNKTSGVTTDDDLEKLRVQALATIRSMLNNSPDRFSSIYPSALRTLLRARTLYEDSSPVVEALAETAERCCQGISSESSIEAILDVLDPPTQDPALVPSSSTLALGFDLIATSLRPNPPTTNTSPALTDALAPRLAQLAIRCLDDLDPTLRHSVATACVGLYERMESHARFWKVMQAAREDQRMLITYHIVKKERERQLSPVAAPAATAAVALAS